MTCGINSMSRHVICRSRHDQYLLIDRGICMSMKRRPTSEQLIREYVSAILKEDNPGYGVSHIGDIDIGDASDILKIFGVPDIKNLGSTIAGVTKEMTTRLKTAIKVLWGATVSLIPGIGYDYAEIFDKEKTELKKVREEYKDVFAATDEAFKGNDMAMFAFMANPGVFLGAKMASAAPDTAKKLLSAATGGKSDEIIGDVIEDLKDTDRWLTGEEGKEREQRLKSKEKRRDARAKGKDTSSPYSLFGGMQDGRVLRGQRLNEEGKDQKGKKLSLSDLLSNKKLIQKIIDSSPELQDAMKRSVEIYRKTLQSAVLEAKKALDGVAYESIIKNSKEKTPQFIEQVKSIAGMKEGDKKAAQEQLVTMTKTQLKKSFVEKLTKRMDDAIKAGADQNSQLIKDHAAAIKKIQAM